MEDILGVLVDGQPQVEFHRSKALPADQHEWLARMDRKMDGGVVLEGQTVANSDLAVRARFVAANLANALAAGKDNLALGLTTWLGTRCPDLKQVRITSGELGMQIDLDYENPYQRARPVAQVVEFHPTRH